MHKGYKFTPEQLANRKRKQKGKWSKRAKERHSIRMKERFAAKKKVAQSVVTTNKLSLNERLNIITHHIEAIKQQLGS